VRYLIFLLLLGFISCVAVPRQDIVVHFDTIDGPRFLQIPEDSLSEKWHGISWWTMDEHLENIKEFLKEQRKGQGT